ncbi:MAG: MBL fold metallo-hydrolase [Deltaproteobacteria bacterium]|jgi:glyoxylase-like metal-dependent hydrolase (beta-lactamase superfamily II)|nr:MBL fold metallo-hydrolase [Deltaproteobacteria bacterium]
MSTRLFLAVFLAAFASLWAYAAISWAQEKTAPPVLGDVAEGFFKFDYGDLTIVALSDAATEMAPELFFDISPEDLAALALQNGLPGPGFPGWINAFIVKKDNLLYLVDAGTGGADPKFQVNLLKAGYTPAEVTHILITHFHGDHIGGLIDQNGEAVYPNANVYASAPEDAYFLPDEGGAPVPGTELAARVTKAYRERLKYRVFAPETEITPGVKAVSFFGHTPGHSGFRFESSAGPFLAWGDIVHAYLVQFARPEVTLSYDVSRPDAARARLEAFRQAVAEGCLVAGAHLPFPGVGKVVAAGEAFRWAPYGTEESQ